MRARYAGKAAATLALFTVAFNAGCRSHPSDGSPKSPTGLAEPRSCKSASQCSTGEICSGQLCGQPPPTSNLYNPCALDADCPSGDYCSLGACSHDCLADRDCNNGTVCTNRGRCTTATEAPKPAPIARPLPPSLEASAESLEFDLKTDQSDLVLRNTGGSALRFRLLSDSKWLSAEPATGEVGPSQLATVHVKVDRSAAGASTHGALAINSTAGHKQVAVFLARDLSGAWAGEVRVTSPFATGGLPLAFNLFQLPDNATLTGYVEAERSLLFPQKAGITGQISGDNVSLQLVVAGAKNSRVNPLVDRGVRRTVTLNGKVTAAGAMEGTFSDSILGPQEQPIAVEGTFSLRWSGPASAGVADPPPVLTFPAITSPYGGAGYAACKSQCPNGDCSGRSFLANSAAFYNWFQYQAGLPSSSPYEKLETAPCDGQACLNELNLRCAQYHYAQTLLATPNDPEASRGLLDTFEVMADYA
ncbi:MAG TPA: hypothetical protein VJ787_07185, partial [Thermoleophilia bacterium]|nr:hypothetical protein [Thermoleophilia bacterium]